MVESGRLEREGCCTGLLSPQNRGVSDISQYESDGRYFGIDERTLRTGLRMPRYWFGFRGGRAATGISARGIELTDRFEGGQYPHPAIGWPAGNRWVRLLRTD